MTKKIILIVVGAVLLLCGIGAIVPGGLLTGVSGSDNTIESGFNSVSTPTVAFVSQTAHVSNASGMRTAGIGAATISISARSTEPIFLGVAAASDVETYLGTAPFDEVTNLDLSPFRLDTARHEGNATPNPPADQTFWIDSSSGTSPSLDWKITDGDYRLVMMNLDGSEGVVAESQFGITVNGLFGIGLGILIAGVVAALIGLALLVLGIALRAAPKQPAFAGAGGAYPAPGGYGPAGPEGPAGSPGAPGPPGAPGSPSAPGSPGAPGSSERAETTQPPPPSDEPRGGPPPAET